MANFVSDSNVLAARAALPSRGLLLIEGAYDIEECARLRSWLDSAPEANAEINYGGSEKRIWNAQDQNDVVREFTSRSDEFLSRMLDTPQKSHTTLAIRNLPANVADPGMVRGRWHIDSFRRQFKLFLFLSDVSAETGPFEFIPGSQHTMFKLRMAVSGRYFGVRGALRGQRAYSKLDDDMVQGLFGRGYQTSPVLCRAGTVMVVDTSAIHRARPCVSAPRYALATYFR